MKMTSCGRDVAGQTIPEALESARAREIETVSEKETVSMQERRCSEEGRVSYRDVE